MTLSKERPAKQAWETQTEQAVEDNATFPEVVDALERQFQSELAIKTEQVQACQLEPGDRVLYKNRLMRVGSIQTSTTRRYGFFVSLLPADYSNPYSDYKRWQAHLKQHRLEIPSNWFTPWHRVKPELETVELHNPFADESEAITFPQAEETKEARVAVALSRLSGESSVGRQLCGLSWLNEQLKQCRPT